MAYGHGAVPLAKEIEAYPYIWGIAVATVEEGMELRNAGIQKPILILGYTYEEDYDRIVREDFRPTVFKISMAKKLSEAAKRAGKTLKIHIKIDTGMTRIGYRNSGNRHSRDSGDLSFAGDLRQRESSPILQEQTKQSWILQVASLNGLLRFSKDSRRQG